jgi:enamine deaminase RidA (YjgF/YER057c/UK114 family)
MRHLCSRPKRSRAHCGPRTDPPSSFPAPATAALKSPNTNAAEIRRRFDYAAPAKDGGEHAMAFAARIGELRIVSPSVGTPLGNYVHAKRVGNLLYLSGKGPPDNNGKAPRGKLGAGMSVEEGYQHARGVGLVPIAVMRDALDRDLARIEDIVKVLVSSMQPPISRIIPTSSMAARICLSRRLASVAGTRVRAIGMSSQRGGIPVEIEVMIK